MNQPAPNADSAQAVRVLYVLNGTLGGANLSALQLAGALEPVRYQPCIAYPSGYPDGVSEIQRACPRSGPAYLTTWRKVREAPLWRRPLMWASRNMRSGLHLRSILQLRAMCRRWGVGLVHSNTSTTLSSALAARALGLPHVWHIREMIGDDAPFHFPPTDTVALRIFAGLSDRLVANSEQAAAFFRRHLGDDAITVIPNGIAAPASELDVASRGLALRSRLGLSADQTVIGVVASLSSAWKGHELVIKASTPLLRARPDVRLVLFGDVPQTPYAAGVQGAIADSGVAGSIVLAGHVVDVWSMMGSLDILAHGTHIESFGRVFLEAMFAGKPVVTPRGGGALTVVDDGVTGFLTDLGDAASMSIRLTQLASDGVLARRMGAAGRTRAAAKFSLEAHVASMTRLYDEVLASRRAQRAQGQQA